MVRHTDTNPSGIAGCGSSSFNALQLDSDNTYDARHQLTRQEQPGSDWAYAYDESGNRVEDIHNGERWTYSYPSGSNRITEKRRDSAACGYGVACWHTYTHNTDGSRAADTLCYQTPSGCGAYRGYFYDALGRTRCSYDPLGRLVHICGGGGVPLGYVGDNVGRTSPENPNTFWTFVHGPGIDDPVMGRYTQDANYGRTYFFATDGQGRQYVVGRSDGHVGSDDFEYTEHGGEYSGAGQVAAAFGVERLPSTGQPGLAFFRNRFYDQETGRWTQEDPIGVAGGLNLYGFVGNNPTMSTDPFGLCAQGDTVRLKVTAYCPGSTTPIQAEVLAVQVTNAEELSRLSAAAGTLEGGTAAYAASAVTVALQAAAGAGRVYVFPAKTADGADVADAGEADGNLLRFRSDVWRDIQLGSRFMNRPTNPRFLGSSCQTMGHEGVHLVQHATGRPNGHPLSEPEAKSIMWRCR
jgi:RHS repeat-associated protein